MKNVDPQNQKSSPTRVQIIARLYAAAFLEALNIVSRCVLILAISGLVVEYLR